jgi:hypothetical protein
MSSRREFLAYVSALFAAACTSKLGGAKSPILPHITPAEIEPPNPHSYYKDPPVGDKSLLPRLNPNAQLPQKGVNYYVPTPHLYFKNDQDLAYKGILYDKILRNPTGWKKNETSTITVANSRGVRASRIRVPGAIHAIGHHEKSNTLYLVGVDQPSSLMAVDPSTLDIKNWITRPTDEEPYIFSGHAIPIPGTNLIATAMTGMTIGKHDHLAIRDAETLKVVDRISTYGFEAHEVILSHDARYFAVAHYGSYMGTGPYKELGLGYVYHYAKKEHGFTYPAFVSVIDAKTGKLEHIFCDKLGGQHGHVAMDDNYVPFIPHLPPFIDPLPENNPRFKEGVQKKPIFHDEFVVRSNGLGVTVTYDRIHKEVVIPARYKNQIVIGDNVSKALRHFSLDDITTQHSPHGLEYHPDGRHYFVSTNDGLLAFERGTHKLIPELCVEDTFLGIHSHFTMYTT